MNRNTATVDGNAHVTAGSTSPSVRAPWQVRLVAGSLVLVGALGSFVVPGLQALSAFVGGGLAFAAISNTCAMGVLLSRMPWNRTPSFDPRKAVAQLADSR